MHFGEYELFPSLIGLSPLSPGHPKTFQRQRVRASTEYYHSFTLPMGRSHGFASTTANWIALFRLAFASAPNVLFLTLQRTSNSLAHYAKGTPSLHLNGAPTACRHTVSGSISLPSRGTFHLSLTVLVHYRSHGSI